MARLYRFRALWALSLLLVLLQALGADEVLAYQRPALLAGSLWQGLSGHFLHLGWMHLAMNLAALLIIGLGFPRAEAAHPARFAAYCLLLAAFISVGLLLASPEVSWYVGLSGVLHGLVALAAIGEWRAHRGLAALLLAGLALKLGWEQLGPDSPSSALIGGRVIVDAHLYGGLGGVLLGLARYRPWR